MVPLKAWGLSNNTFRSCFCTWDFKFFHLKVLDLYSNNITEIFSLVVTKLLNL